MVFLMLDIASKYKGFLECGGAALLFRTAKNTYVGRVSPAFLKNYLKNCFSVVVRDEHKCQPY